MAIQLSKQQVLSQNARLRNIRGDLAHAYGVALTRWMGDPVLMALGLPIITQGYRAGAEQAALYAQGRESIYEINRLRKLAGMPVIAAAEGRIKVTWVTVSRHLELPSGALDVAMRQADGSVTWPVEPLRKFARLMLAANPLIRWGGDWDQDGDSADEKSPDFPHFEVPK